MARPAQIPYLFPAGARLGIDNVMLHARARRHDVSAYAGPLSIKTVLAGEVAWIVAGRELVVDQSSVLIINAGEPYSMHIDAPKPVETCCAFFAPGFVERTALDMTSPLDRALETPDRAAPALPYLTALHGDRERSLARLVQALRPSGLEEDFLVLAADLLHYYDQIRQEAARLPSVRESTRRELFRRVLIGRDYLHAHACGAVSLAEAANAACLSPFHFHRGFTKAFQQTPHGYLTGLRLERARRMLESGTTALHACLETGFSSPAAFSRLFRTHFGVLPSEARRGFARSGKNGVADSVKLEP